MRFLHVSLLSITLPFLTTASAASATTSQTSTESTYPFTTPLAQLPILNNNEINSESGNTDNNDTALYAPPPSSPQPLFPLNILFARQATTATGSCPANYFGCSNLGAPQACCVNTAICTTDGANHVACCASGASCTGIIGGGGNGGTGGSSGVTGSTAASTTGSGGAVLSTNGIIVTAGSPVSGALMLDVGFGKMMAVIVAGISCVALAW